MPTASGPFASAVSRHPVSAHAAGEVVGAVLERLGAHPDLALLFVTPGHAGALEDIGAAVRALLSPSVLLGIVSGAVIGPADDVEHGPGISLWCGLVGPVVPLVLDGQPVRAGFRPSAAVVLADSASPPAAEWPPLFEATGAAGGPGAAVDPLAVAGGVTSRTGLLVQDRVVTGTPVGALIGPAVRATALVSEGGRAIGDPMVVTRAERSMVYELDGRPALERLLELVADRMPAQDVRLVNDGLRLAVLDRSDHPRTPALVVRGADRSNGALGVEGAVSPGSVVRFQVRDPRVASEAFERALADAEPSGVAGALLFRSEARPPAWFGGLPSDAASVAESCPAAALGGCAAARQVGPVAPAGALATDRAALLLLDEAHAGWAAGREAAPG